MKNRTIVCLVLCSLIFSAISYGCEKDLDSYSETTTEKIQIEKTPENTQKTTKNPTEFITESQYNFDFKKTLEFTYVCGQQLTSPLAWGRFGDDFSIIPKDAFYSEKN